MSRREKIEQLKADIAEHFNREMDLLSRVHELELTDEERKELLKRSCLLGYFATPDDKSSSREEHSRGFQSRL